MGGDGLKAKAVTGSGETPSLGKSGLVTWFSLSSYLFMFSQPPWVQKEVRREKIKISKVSGNLGSSCCQDNSEGGSALLIETLDDARSHSKGSQPYDGPFCLIDDRNNGKRLSPKAVSKGVSRITEHQPHPVP